MEYEVSRPGKNAYLVSDDIWAGFGVEMQPSQQQLLPQAYRAIMSAFATVCGAGCQVIHDCMWNGHCKDKEKCKCCIRNGVCPGGVKPPASQVSSSQQSLLKPDLKVIVDPNSVVPMMSSYHYTIQTPPISDDEDTKPTQILKNLQSAISENEFDDGDLSDYLKGDVKEWVSLFDDELDEEMGEEEQLEAEQEEDEEEDGDEEEIQRTAQEQKENYLRAYYAANDHSYHKGTHAAVHSDSLGIDTPSDSEEEEIDVVSVGDKSSSSKAAAGALPTVPSTQDRRQLQRTMQNRFPQGVKTIMPVKRGATAHTSQGKRVPENRGRGRQYKKGGKQNNKQYKKRFGYGHSSDSEPEPSEKRHLHNNMERQRRIDLRNLFNDLKKLVPDVSKKQRAAKVAILRGAAQYCQDLQYNDQTLLSRVSHLRKQQSRLREKLSKLRRDVIAAKR